MIKIRQALPSIHRACVTLTSLAVLAGCASAPITGAPPAPTGWIKDEVADSYVFAYPLVLMSTMRDATAGDGPGQAPFNTLMHAQGLPPVGASQPPTPSLDTLDSTAWLDLSEEPIIVSLPDSRGRYVDARVLDMWTNVAWWTGMAPGARGTGIKPQRLAFVGPGWQGTLPDNVKRVDVPTRNAWLDIRIQSAGTRDVAAVRRLQRAIRIEPLSATGGDREPKTTSRAATASFAPGSTAPLAQVAAMSPQAFFGRLAQELPDSPPSPNDPHALKILADLGVTPGQPVKLPANAGDAIRSGIGEARERIATPPPNLLSVNGWSWFSDGVGSYGPDYALRAYAASMAPGIGTRENEVRAFATQDTHGQALDGSHLYRIHFAAYQVPPVRGFWSLTAYTKDGALADTANARVALGDRQGVRRNRDGSIDVVVSSTRTKGGNWLPAPRADFQLVLRLYGPKPQATDGSWQPPGIVRQ